MAVCLAGQGRPVVLVETALALLEKTLSSVGKVPLMAPATLTGPEGTSGVVVVVVLALQQPLEMAKVLTLEVEVVEVLREPLAALLLVELLSMLAVVALVLVVSELAELVLEPMGLLLLVVVVLLSERPQAMVRAEKCASGQSGDRHEEG